MPLLAVLDKPLEARSVVCLAGDSPVNVFVYDNEVVLEGKFVDIKERMANVGMTQVDMILELQKRGYAVQPPMMSSILRGVYTYPKAKQILAVCEEILKERENE